MDNEENEKLSNDQIKRYLKASYIAFIENDGNISAFAESIKDGIKHVRTVNLSGMTRKELSTWLGF